MPGQREPDNQAYDEKTHIHRSPLLSPKLVACFV